jgi:hypothetical protein
MSDLTPPAAAPLWPRLVAIVGLLWSGYGLSLLPRVFEALRTGSVDVLAGLCFAIGVLGLLLGSLCLLLRRGWPIPLLAVALLGDIFWAVGFGQYRLAGISALIDLVLILAAFGARRR